jgi:hypothetical protein
LNSPPQTSSQALSVTLKTEATRSKTINQNVLGVVANNEEDVSINKIIVLFRNLGLGFSYYYVACLSTFTRTL